MKVYHFETIDIGDGDFHRVKVVRLRGFDGFISKYTAPCSGCCESISGNATGVGCHECGYHGRVRHAEWCPLPREAARWMRRNEPAYIRLARLRQMKSVKEKA